MASITLRTLQQGDAALLLDFERENRAWFEQHVEARGDDFYRPDGIALHIDDYLRDHAAGRWHPCVALDAAGRIVGRGNLKDIDGTARAAEVGYRVARAATGMGVAGAILQHLTELASVHWKLVRLQAYASDANPASSRVLERHGFVAAEAIAELLMVDGAWRSGRRFELSLPNEASSF